MVDSESDNDIWNEIYKSLQGSPEGATQSVQPPLLPQDEVPAFGTIDATTSSAAPPPLPDTPALECPKCHGALVISDGFGCGRGHVTMLSHAHGFADFCGTERRSCCQCKKYILSARRLNRLCNFGLEGFLLWRSAREPVDRVTVSPDVIYRLLYIRDRTAVVLCVPGVSCSHQDSSGRHIYNITKRRELAKSRRLSTTD